MSFRFIRLGVTLWLTAWIGAVAPSNGRICFSFRWVMKSNRKSCCANGWTVAWPTAASWWLFRKVLAVATTHSLRRWWRSGWTGTGKSGRARLYPTVKRRRMMTTSDETGVEEEGGSLWGGADLLLPPLSDSLYFFPFMTRTNCEILQERSGNPKPPTHVPPPSDDTATILAHAGTRTLYVQHWEELNILTEFTGELQRKYRFTNTNDPLIFQM